MELNLADGCVGSNVKAAFEREVGSQEFVFGHYIVVIQLAVIHIEQKRT